jgi:amidase/aspartyl-tRNA(Asn)/glutamyl-tRNA(Gln) amidotransferase subunit A
MTDDYCWMSASELAQLIRQRDINPVDVVDAHLRRIEQIDGELNAYVTVLADEAMTAAADAARAVSSGQRLGPLHGVPVAIKDLSDFKRGVRNTFGSRPMADFVPDRDSTYVSRIERSGAIIIGKTNTPEFGHKGTTDNLLHGPTSTPFAVGRNSGGSSGGSAAAVAAGLAPIAQGSDGGGSVRIPAAWCGVYGFIGSYGRLASVTRPDGFATQTPFISPGPLSRTVADAALLFSVMAGPDRRDPFSLPGGGLDSIAATARPAGHLRVACDMTFGGFPVEPAVATVFAEAVRSLADCVQAVEPVELNLGLSHADLTALWMRQNALSCAGVAIALQEQGIDLLGNHAHEMSPELVALIEQGYGLSVRQQKLDAMARTRVLDKIESVFERYDLFVTATLGCLPVPNDPSGHTKGPSAVNNEPVDPLIGWCLTHPVNLIGHPAASAPAGLSSNGLPVGLQLIGPQFGEEHVLTASAAFEQVRPWIDSYAGTDLNRRAGQLRA